MALRPHTIASAVTWAFAYGSNMDTDHLRHWFRDHGHDPLWILEERAALGAGLQLVWNYQASMTGHGAANASNVRCSELPGVALRLTRRGLWALDDKEAHRATVQRSRYRRRPRRIRLLSAGDWFRGWVYFARPDLCRKDAILPTQEYLDHLVKGASDHGLPARHVEWIRATKTAPDNTA